MARLAVTALALCGCTLVGCGDSGRPAARVGQTLITKGEIAHEIKRANLQKPEVRISASLKRQCAAIRGRSEWDVARDPKTRTLPGICSEVYRTETGLSLAIEHAWVLHEAAAEGETVTDAQLRDELAHSEGFTKDEARIVILENRLRDELAPVKDIRTPGAVAKQENRFRDIMRSRWLQKTVCLNGYSASGTFSPVGAACRNP